MIEELIAIHSLSLPSLLFDFFPKIPRKTNGKPDLERFKTGIKDIRLQDISAIRVVTRNLLQRYKQTFRSMRK